MPEGAALSWPLSDIVIRRKGRLAFRYRVPGCSLLDQRPVSADFVEEVDVGRILPALAAVGCCGSSRA
ncbi:MAG TPA: hypothetical protein VJ251_09620, partial [Stellaceae bacterium]|nr:hypothetical protein [Stellaceae bacterium]